MIDKQHVLPQQNFTDYFCSAKPCYIAGDLRVTQTPQLAQIHSLFYRLHNKCAKELYKYNKSWNDEKLFKEARRITIAIYQSMMYGEWLPYYLGWFR